MLNTNPGIYRIENTETRKVYIGQAGNLKKRYCDHVSALRRNNHDNKYLQNAWNKYTEETFVFSILEECAKEKLAQREQYWMDYYRCYERQYGYNINPSATENPMLGQTHTPEARAKMSAKAKGRVMSESNKEALIKANKGVAKPPRKLKEKSIVNYRKDYTRNKKYRYWLFDTEDNYYTTDNLTEFCRENRYSLTHLRGMIFKNKFYKGWHGWAEPLIEINLQPNIKLLTILNIEFNYA
jgi:group I intron endonuclease